MKKVNIIRFVLLITALTMLSVGDTFSWIEEIDEGGFVNVNKVVVSSSGSVTMKQNGSVTDNILVSNFKLEEVSSADGRNYFFPMTDNTSTEAGKMLFRKGTPSDKNSKYVCLDFTLEAVENVDEVFLGSGTLVQCSNSKLLEALRMSLSLNDGSDPIVFKPIQLPGEEGGFSPITRISDDGAGTPQSIRTKPYGDYYYKGEGYDNYLFSFAKNKTLNVTLSIWLEGTAFTGDDVLTSDIGVFFDFTTPDKLIKYCFEDDCHVMEDARDNRWIENNVKDVNVEHPTMMYVFDTDTQRYHSMVKIKDTNRWEGYIPENVTDFYFRRYTARIDKWWNQWEPDLESIPVVNGERTYVAVYGEETVDGSKWGMDGGFGYWKDAEDTIRVYFRLEENWDNLRCYARANAEITEPLGPAPGAEMTFSHYAGDSSSDDFSVSKPVYYIEIKDRTTIKSVQFSNGGSDEQKCEVSDLKNFFNGLYAWYINHSTYGIQIYSDTINSQIYPFNDPTP